MLRAWFPPIALSGDAISHQTLKQAFTELNSLEALVSHLSTRREVWGRVNYIKLFGCSLPHFGTKYLDRGVRMKVGLEVYQERQADARRKLWKVQVRKEKPSPHSLKTPLDFWTCCSLLNRGTTCLRAVSTRICQHYGLNSSCLPSCKAKHYL